MKKLVLIFCISTSIVLQVKSGGLVTNSNQSASYYRMLARGASISGDAVYYNPAGLVFLDQGFTVSLNSQMIWMQRTINNDLSTLNNTKFVGNLYVPVFPGVYAAYKTGNWAFSLGFNPPAGGGSIEFKEGLPMLENTVSLIPGLLSSQALTTTRYSMQAMMKGTSIAYGIQAGASYKINETIGVSGGIRMLFANNSYEGYVRDIMINPVHPILKPNDDMVSASAFLSNPALPPALGALAAATVDQSLDVKQTGRGIAPIFGVHLKLENLNLAAKYEFRTKITLVNETKKNALNMYPDGQKLRSDVPALLSLAGSYDIIPALKFSVTYIHHFEKQANLESWSPDATLQGGGIKVQRQDYIKGGTNEYLAGLEWKLNDKLTISSGCQLTKFNVSDAWQNDITHHLNNFTMGLGAAYHFGERLTLNIGGLYTWYNPVSVKGVAAIQGTPVAVPYNQNYDRTNKAIAIGIDYRF